MGIQLIQLFPGQYAELHCKVAGLPAERRSVLLCKGFRKVPDFKKEANRLLELQIASQCEQADLVMSLLNKFTSTYSASGCEFQDTNHVRRTLHIRHGVRVFIAVDKVPTSETVIYRVTTCLGKVAT